MTMLKNPLLQVLNQGQAVWVDGVQRSHLLSGELRQLMKVDGVRGGTANPTPFEQSLDDPARGYGAQLRELIRQNLDANAIYERLAIDDARMACDLFLPLYDRLGGADGFVSLEISPKLAHDTQGAMAEVRRFWNLVARPNLMIKIPGTREALPVIEEALYMGINVNITLLFSLAMYEQVAWAYIRALERRVAERKPIDAIASVASLFVSHIDTLADQWLAREIRQIDEPPKVPPLEMLKGKVGIANAKMTYQRFQYICADARVQALLAQGARVQRPLWASASISTSTPTSALTSISPKNPAYPDLTYAEALIGPDTINTMPFETLAAFRDHGVVGRTLDGAIREAHQTLLNFADAGFSLETLASQLLHEGISKSDHARDNLLRRLDRKREQELRKDRGPVMTYRQPMAQLLNRT